MNQEEMRQEFYELYDMMSISHDVKNMQIFGSVHKEIMEWMIQNKPEIAMELIGKLESIRWKNYLTPKEAQKIVDGMVPKAPWTQDQWKQAMDKHGFDTEKSPCYNSCALWTTMNMKMSDSGETYAKYIEGDKIFEAVYHLAVDSLTDKDDRFKIREYFGL